jgi:co-chaperonin GroES (HSP10)
VIRPLTNCVLLRLLPRETVSSGGVTIPAHTVTPEEQVERNRHPEPPEPVKGRVLAIGPWRTLKNGMKVPPPFPPDSTVLIREGSGKRLSYGTDEKLRLVNIDDDVLAIVSDGQ